MSSATLGALLVAFVGAALAPVVADIVPRSLLPIVVAEIGFGILVGPHGLNITEPDGIVLTLARLGLCALMFLAGYEINFKEIRGRPLQLAGAAWALSLLFGLGTGLVLAAAGEVRSGILVGLCLTTTAIGVVLPILSDSGELHTSFGVRALGVGAVGEFAPIVAVALLLSTDSPARTVSVLVLFVALSGGAALLAMRPHSRRLARVVTATLETSGQLAVRICVVTLVALVWLASHFGLDVLLGAFTAGIVFRLFTSAGSHAEREVIDGKIRAIGFGFLVPLFFIVTGMRFDLGTLTDDATIVLRMLGFTVLLLVVRGLPALLVYRRELPAGDRSALALISATGLPLIVVITTLGLDTGRMRTGNATALVGAGMLSVLVFPALAMVLHRREAATVVGSTARRAG